MPELTGRIHSFQSLGALDGPGLRYVVFFQGCSLRCVYCHNPDTWDAGGGKAYSVPQIVAQALRCRPYWGEQGGVTLSGGEPLFQPEFAAALLEALRKEGIHTVLDTAGILDGEPARRVLRHTDLVLADVKFLSAEDYHTHAKGNFTKLCSFLRLTEAMKIPLWIRHVVVPGLTDAPEHIRNLQAFAAQFSNLEKIELLPFRRLCAEKYQNLGIPFPLADTPEADPETIRALRRLL